MMDKIKAMDGKESYIYCWDKVKEPKAMLQIFMVWQSTQVGSIKQYRQQKH